MTENKFENIRTYPDWGEYVIGGGVILFFIFASKFIWTSIFLIILLILLMWFRVRLIRFKEDHILVLYPFRFFKRRRIYEFDKVSRIQVMSVFSSPYTGSPKISFRLSDKRNIVLRYDSTQFKMIIGLIGSKKFNPKVKVGSETLYKIAKSNPEAKVIREYVPKR